MRVTSRRTRASILFALGPLIAPLACSSPGPTEVPPRNLVLVTIDTLRADHLGCYGYFRETTPNLDRLAAESIVFDRCFAPIAQTTPSHLSLMTSVYPIEHGVTANFVNENPEVQRENAFRSSDDLATIATRLRNQGYRTGGFVSASPVKRITGLASGFETWSEPDDHRRSGSETTAEVLAWLDGVTGPYFLWVHYFDPHGPYVPPEHPPPPYDTRYAADDALARHLAEREFPPTVEARFVPKTETDRFVNLYDGSVRMFDDAFGELLEALDTRDDRDATVLVVTADHGQGLGQHEFATHGLVWDEQLRVPLLVRVPGEAPHRVSVSMSSIDVVPTVLRFLPRFDPDPYWRQARGQDVLDASFPGTPVFGMSTVRRGLRTLIEDRWKLIVHDGGDVRLFDLEADPFELTDVRAAESPRAREMAERLERLVADQRERGGHFRSRVDPDAIVAPVDEKLLDEMRALGYVGDDRDVGEESDARGDDVPDRGHEDSTRAIPSVDP
jgi:arylsulfatase